MTDEEMPPRPECEFEFNLPHGIDSDDATPNSTAMLDDSVVHMHPEEVRAVMEDADADRPNDDSIMDNEQNAQQAMNYDTFKLGFSDDEGGDEAFDYSWEAQKARKPSQKKKKKSPRRSQDSDVDDEASPRAKKSRQSLFGGPGGEIENEEHNEHTIDQDVEPIVPKTPGHSIGNRMSSMNLEEHDAQEDHISSLYLGAGTSNWDSRSPIPSRAVSEESIVIPPDDQVSETPRLMLFLHTPLTVLARL
jgi:hypothetical protein